MLNVKPFPFARAVQAQMEYRSHVVHRGESTYEQRFLDLVREEREEPLGRVIGAEWIWPLTHYYPERGLY